MTVHFCHSEGAIATEESYFQHTKIYNNRREHIRMKFKALVIREEGDSFIREITERDTSDLPKGDLLVKVLYSSLNYKDALSAAGNRGVTKKYPHTPGIDAAGTVAESGNPEFAAGDEVLITGHDFGMNTSGGFAEYVRVPSSWAIKRPEGITLKEAMIYGTAGFTAALSIYRLSEYGGVKPGSGRILVTGARGGVGSHAVRLLSIAGYEVTAVTGLHSNPEKDFPEDEKALKAMGALKVIPADAVSDKDNRPMLKSKWAGVIDTVGGSILSTAIRETAYGGAVTTCGNAAGADFYANVYPFILRGVNLFGIDSVECPHDLREATWKKMAGEWYNAGLNDLGSECSLEEIKDSYIDLMLKGYIKERKVVNIAI